MYNFIMQHQVASALIAAYFFSSLIGALPSPTEKSSPWYQFIYQFMHLLGANALRIPWVRNVLGVTNAS
jgi:hypothetical protein